MKDKLIVEDNSSIRRLLQYDFGKMSFNVRTAENGQEAYELCQNETFDVIIVDWMMPIMDGRTLVSHLRAQGNQSIIIMLTAKDDENDVLDAFEAGVDDYMSKPFSPRELSARVSAHLKRSAKVVDQNQKLTFGNLSINEASREVYIEKALVDLTRLEFDLLYYLLNHQNVVLSRDKILNHIWQFDYDGDSRVVDVHIFKIRQKIANASVNIEAERGIGYVAKRK